VSPLLPRLFTLAAMFVVAGATASTGRPADTDYPIKPVPFTAVKVTDGFWAPRIETNRTITIPAIFKKCEETGRIDNFAIAGGLMKGEYKGERYNDTDVYKTIEGASYSLMVHPQDRRGPGTGRISLYAANGEPRQGPARDGRRTLGGAGREPRALQRRAPL